MAILKSFKYALEGIREALKGERNMRVHVIVAIIILALALILKFSPLELTILTLTIGFVFAMELINTSLEEIVNIVSPQIQEKARIAKDVAAASVLISALVATLVGAFLFLPKIF